MSGDWNTQSTTSYSVPLSSPQPTTEPSQSQEKCQEKGNGKARGRGHRRWLGSMDYVLVHTLYNGLGMGVKKSDNGFTKCELQKVVNNMLKKCKIVVTIENVRARLRTLKKEWLEVQEIFKLSGFGWDPITGRATAPEEVWAEYLVGKKDPHKIRARSCVHYDLLTVMFGNDTATGEEAVIGGDFELNMNISEQEDDDIINLGDMDDEDDYMSTPPPTVPGPSSQTTTSATSSRSKGIKRRRSVDRDEALSTAIEALGAAGNRIATSLELIDWGVVEQQICGVPRMNEDDLISVLELFEKDNNLARMFMGMNDIARENWVTRKLGHAPTNYFYGDA